MELESVITELGLGSKYSYRKAGSIHFCCPFITFFVVDSMQIFLVLNCSSLCVLPDGMFTFCITTIGNSVAPPLLSSISQGGFTGKFFFSLRLQLRPLATLVPRLGRVGQGTWELGLPNSRKCHF